MIIKSTSISTPFGNPDTYLLMERELFVLCAYEETWVDPQTWREMWISNGRLRTFSFLYDVKFFFITILCWKIVVIWLISIFNLEKNQWRLNRWFFIWKYIKSFSMKKQRNLLYLWLSFNDNSIWETRKETNLRYALLILDTMINFSYKREAVLQKIRWRVNLPVNLHIWTF